jgi:hypothetical protein
MSRRIDPKIAVIAVLAVLAIAGGLFWQAKFGGSSSAKDRIQADPPPTLFVPAQTAPIAQLVDAQRSVAAQDLRTWVAAHGTRPDDKAFVAWAEETLPPPPKDLPSEMNQVVSLTSTRTPAGVRAATWLETYGKKDVWKLFAHDQGELLNSKRADALKGDEKDALKMAKTVADTLGTKYGSSAPYVRQPSLRKDHQVTPGQTCPCSYPSRHATAGAASETLLGGLQPELDPQYRYYEHEIDFSRVYMAGHFPSDVSAGALLGDLIGDYFLVTREGVDPSTLT